MFPSEAYRELCIENQGVLREEAIGLESGDWVLRKEDNWVFLVIEADLESEALHLYGGPDIQTVHDDTLHWRDRYIPLFQPRQLIEMLEERGYSWCIGDGEGRYSIGLYERTDMIFVGTWEGPDPATALLEAYLGVAKEEK